jgi:energy-coupling factor transport system substrate-specific component
MVLVRLESDPPVSSTEQGVNNPPRITTKDLINLGIFGAVYVVSFFVIGMLGFIPILMLGLPLLLPVVTGIPFMLYATRVHTFGMISVLGLIVGLVMFLFGEGWVVLVFSIVCAVLADLIMKSGGYVNWPKTLLAFGVFSAWVFGALMPIWVMRESYLEHLRKEMGATYAHTVANYTAGSWVLIILLVVFIIGVFAGGYLGRATLKKHFVRAGIA